MEVTGLAYRRKWFSRAGLVQGLPIKVRGQEAGLWIAMRKHKVVNLCSSNSISEWGWQRTGASWVMFLASASAFGTQRHVLCTNTITQISMDSPMSTMEQRGMS